MKEKSIHYSKWFFAFLMAIWSLITLCFNFTNINMSYDDYYFYGESNGYDLMKMLTYFNKNGFWMGYILGLFALLLFVTALLSLLIVIFFGLFGKNAQSTQKSRAITVALSLCIGGLYTLGGIVYTIALRKAEYPGFTQAYVPLVIMLLLFCFYLLIPRLLHKSFSNQPEGLLPKQKMYEETADKIKYLKGLLDKGIITEKEYNEKKNQYFHEA